MIKTKRFINTPEGNFNHTESETGEFILFYPKEFHFFIMMSLPEARRIIKHEREILNLNKTPGKLKTISPRLHIHYNEKKDTLIIGTEDENGNAPRGSYFTCISDNFIETLKNIIH